MTAESIWATLKTAAVLFSLGGAPIKMNVVWQPAGTAPSQVKAEWRGSSDLFYGKSCKTFRQLTEKKRIPLKCCDVTNPTWDVKPFALVITPSLDCPPNRSEGK